jgi:crotonobetainyl-CoA:carnitine CoA-transferase CaiB-like acyl-CoA transferase
MPKRKVMEVLQKQGVPAGAVLNQPEVFQDPQLSERRFFQVITHPETGTHEYPSMMARMSRTPNEIRLPPPLLGEHNEYVYKGILGLTNGQYQELEEAGHIGMDYAEDVP